MTKNYLKDPIVRSKLGQTVVYQHSGKVNEKRPQPESQRSCEGC